MEEMQMVCSRWRVGSKRLGELEDFVLFVDIVVSSLLATCFSLLFPEYLLGTDARPNFYGI